MTPGGEAGAPAQHRLVYICDWLPPDFGAVGQYSLLFARERAARGERVNLVGLSSGPGDETVEEHGAGRLEIRRVQAPTYDRADFRRRAWWTARTNLRLVRAAWPALRRADEILFTGSPPFLLHLLAPLNVVLRKRLTYRITDFHPECLIAELGRAPLALRWFRSVTWSLRRRVDRFEVLGEDQRRRLVEIGIGPGRIVLKRDPSPVAIDPRAEPLRRPAELGEGPVLLYSGNFGVAHEHETFLAGYRAHHAASGDGRPRVRLWLNATGARADLVEAALRGEGLPVVRTRPVPLDQLARLLVTPDAHLITLRDEFVGYVLPSKVYGCAASGRPVLFIGSEASDVDLVCRERVGPGDYVRAAVGDADSVRLFLETLAQRRQTLHPATPSRILAEPPLPAAPSQPGKGVD